MRKRDWRARVEFEDSSVVESPVRFLQPLTREKAVEALRHTMEELSGKRVKRVCVW